MSEKVLSQQDAEETFAERKARGEKFDKWICENKTGCAYSDSPMCRACIQEYREAYINGELDVKETEEQKINRQIAGKPEPETDMFPVECHGDLRCGLGRIEGGMSDEEFAVAGMFNPVVWFKQELGINLRWYQEDAVCCTARMKALRWGRRSGKTHSQVGRILHRMQLARLNEDEKQAAERVLVLAPYQPQVDEIFEKIDELIVNSNTLCESENRRTKSPNQIYKMGNNSQAKGFCTGSKTGSKSDKTRGQGATIIYMDEVDYIPDSDIESTIAIITDSKDTELWVTSTPSGKRGKFYGFCTDKRQGFKHFHVSAKESPEWTDKTERLLRAQYSRAAWEHEIEAEFGTVEGGVFPTNKLIDSLYTYKYGIDRYNPNNIYCIGVDWNGAANGIPIIVTEFDRVSNRYVVVDKKTSMSDEFTQLTAIRDIITMFEKWNANYIYLDAGYGNAQFEMLRAYAKEAHNDKLLKAAKAIHMHGKTIIRDPVSKKKIEKQNKSLMIDLAVRRVENDMCAFPHFENEEGGLVDQLRNLEIERYTPTGIPVYSQGKDHEAVAWLLSVFAITMEFSDIAKVASGGHIAFMPFKVLKEETFESQIAKDTLIQAPRKEPDDPSKDFVKGGKSFHVMSRTKESQDKRGVTFGGRSKFMKLMSSGRKGRSF